MQFQKWLNQIEPQHSIADAAVVTLRQRLSAVSYLLPLAANRHKESPEPVHQLRIWCRRSLAAIALYEEQLPAADVTWFTKWLGRILKAAGEARDLDVLLKRHAKRLHKPSYQPLHSVLRKLRKKAQQPIIVMNERIGTTGKFERRIDHLIGCLDSASSDCFQVWAEGKLNIATASFFSSLPAQTSKLRAADLESLHQFRINGKALRYTMELLTPAFPAAFRDSLYPITCQLQVELGDLHDHVAAAERLNKLKKKHDSKQLKKLIAKEKQAIRSAADSYHTWWTPQQTHNFFDLLHKLTRSTKLV